MTTTDSTFYLKPYVFMIEYLQETKENKGTYRKAYALKVKYATNLQDAKSKTPELGLTNLHVNVMTYDRFMKLESLDYNHRIPEIVKVTHNKGLAKEYAQRIHVGAFQKVKEYQTYLDNYNRAKIAS